MKPLHLLPGETILWEGQPDWRGLARSVFHIGFVALYFALLIAANAAAGWVRGFPPGKLAAALVPLAGLAVGSVGILSLFCWMMARTTVYAITTRRVILRYGVAFPATLSLPLRVIWSVSVRVNKAGCGDILLVLRKGEHAGFFRLWPLVHLQRSIRAQPVLRAVPGAGLAACLLSRTLQAAQAEALRVVNKEAHAAQLANTPGSAGSGQQWSDQQHVLSADGSAV